MKLERGSVVAVGLDPTVGHEQRGVRPCVVINDPEVLAMQRFDLVCVVPITGTAGRGALYPRLQPGVSGLAKPSYALVDHLRSIDRIRVRSVYGRVSATEIDAIDLGIRLFLGLDD